MAERRRHPLWVWLDRIGPLLMLLALLVGFAIADFDGFVNAYNFKVIMSQSAILITCALGMTMILVSGGLDLSVGSTIALAAVVGAHTFAASHSTFLALGACLAMGAGVGATNGLLIAGLRMSPFIVTLGMMGVARGLARVFADDSKVRLPDEVDADNWIIQILDHSPDVEPWASIGIPCGVGVTVLLIALMAVVMRRTVFGRHVYAIGSNEDSARLCGVRVTWTKYLIYIFAGALFGFAGLMQLGFDNLGDSTARTGFELKVIAAVVIGGASLMGGAGTILGTLVGALIMVVLSSGFTILDVPAAWQELVIGAVIVAAVALDMLRQGTLNLDGLRRLGVGLIAGKTPGEGDAGSGTSSQGERP